MSSTGLGAPSFVTWNAGSLSKPCGWIISRPRNRKLTKPCCARSASVGKFERSPRIVTTFGRSCVGHADPVGRAEHEVVLVCHRLDVAGGDLVVAAEQPVPVERRRAGRHDVRAVDRDARDDAGEVGELHVARDPERHARARCVGEPRSRRTARRVQVARHDEGAVHLARDLVVLGGGEVGRPASTVNWERCPRRCRPSAVSRRSAQTRRRGCRAARSLRLRLLATVKSHAR